MVEFALNSAINSSSGFTPFKLNYGYIPTMNTGFTPQSISVPSIKHFVKHTLQNLTEAHDAIIESRVHQMHNANHCQRTDDHFIIGDLVYMSTADLLLPKGHTSKLLLKYVGPFKVLEAQTSTSSYKIELPAQLHAWNFHDQFH